MKLKKIYKSVLNEIGDSSSTPPNSRYFVSRNSGEVEFAFGKSNYIIVIRIPILQENKMALSIDFTTRESDLEMTNQHQALKVMSYIVGGLEEWLSRYKTKFYNDLGIEIVYIKYDPKSEESEEWNADDFNRRDKIYRAFLTKFAKKYNTSVSFQEGSGIVAKFNPSLKIN